MVVKNALNATNVAYSMIVGTGSSYSSIPPDSTSGIPLISMGASSNPAYGTAVVAGGGTGVSSVSAYNVVCGGTTSTAALQSVAPSSTVGYPLVSAGVAALPTFSSLAVPGGGTGVQTLTANSVVLSGATTTAAVRTTPFGTTGQVLVANGISAIPTFQTITGLAGAFTSIVQRVFTSSGTYTPTAGMKYCIIECIGGGGGGGGCTGAVGAFRISGGGAAGGYARSVFSAATIGASRTITIGSAGSGGNASGTNGTAGGTTTVSGIGISATGGAGGKGFTTGNLITTGAMQFVSGGIGTGQIIGRGGSGLPPITAYVSTENQGVGGLGGASYLGQGGVPPTSADTNGTAATINGAGGSGCATSGDVATGRSGGAGAAGVVIITEFC